MARESEELTSRYLARIGLKEAPPIDLDGLERLQRAHLTTVPFENLDVFAQRDVDTVLEWSLPKIVDRGRGGWCFELNGAFASLLMSLGFDVSLHGATVLLPPAADDPSHLTLVVHLDAPYLVDVGFGDSFIRPLMLQKSGPQDGGSGVFALEHHEGHITLSEVDAEGRNAPQYRFTLDEWKLADFREASDRLRNTPGLSWSQSRFATRLIDGGPDRVTILEDRIKFRRDGSWTESPVTQESWPVELDRWFSLTS